MENCETYVTSSLKNLSVGNHYDYLGLDARIVLKWAYIRNNRQNATLIFIITLTLYHDMFPPYFGHHQVYQAKIYHTAQLQSKIIQTEIRQIITLHTIVY
jgi:hypothetical protein